jgi:hypothetical protein
VLGPLFFILYTAELSQVVAAHGLKLHQYADDCQVYATTLAGDAAATVEVFSACVTDVAKWMSINRLRLNPSKTQVMWLGSRQQLQKITITEVNILSSTVTVVNTARDLGVVIDSQLTMSAHVSALCRSCYFQLRQLRPLARSLTTNTTRTLVQAFISCRLDYCNSLFYGMTDMLFQRLQSIQNAAARLATGTRRSEHIQPALHHLHWLPVRKRVDFKLATLVYQALHGLLPSYLSDDCQLITDTGRRQLRSSTNNTCFVPRSHNSFGDRSFSVAGPALWNSLPSSLRSPEHGFSTFKRLLKTYLF